MHKMRPRMIYGKLNKMQLKLLRNKQYLLQQIIHLLKTSQFRKYNYFKILSSNRFAVSIEFNTPEFTSEVMA